MKKPDADQTMPTRASALRLARRLGCEGAHEVPGGGWAPCPTGDALIATARDGAAGYQKWKATQGKDGERERGVAGIDTMPGGGMVSAKSYDMMPMQRDMRRGAAERTYLRARPEMRDESMDGPAMMGFEREDSTHLLNLRQISLVHTFQRTAEEYGKFDQGTGPDGAHYVAKSPFGGEGLVCANCALYEGPRGCEVVEGDIAPEAICKFWVIPEDLLKSED